MLNKSNLTALALSLLISALAFKAATQVVLIESSIVKAVILK